MKPSKIRNYASKVISTAKDFGSKADAKRKSFREGDLEYVAQTANHYEKMRHIPDTHINKAGNKAARELAEEQLNFARGFAVRPGK
jgi:hypothetical protein